MKTFTIIDIETTGLSHNLHEITEIAAIKVNASTLEVIDTYTSLVKIKGVVPMRISYLTGITNYMLRSNGKMINKVLSELSDFCDQDDIYAHNAQFDKNFIRMNLNRENIDFFETEWIDTISIFKKFFPGRKTYKLESLIQDFRLADKEEHRALSDAMHTLKLLKIAFSSKKDL